MAREFSRNARVSSQLHKELAVVMQTTMKDPRLGFVTVSDVEVSRDLAIAKIYVSLFDADAKAVTEKMTILTEAANYIRQEVGKRMKMRRVPHFKFYYDDALETGMRISKLLDGSDSEGLE